jgi:hypothetical protein
MENPEEYQSLNGALRELLAKGLISCEWDPDAEDFVFFMDGDQRAKYDTEYPDAEDAAGYSEEDPGDGYGSFEERDIPDGW